MTPASLPTRQSAQRVPGGLHQPDPAPRDETRLRCQALLRAAPAPPGSEGESPACSAHPGPASLPSPEDTEHRLCPSGGHRLHVLAWLPFTWLAAPRDSFKMFSPSLPFAMCMQQIFLPPPSPGEMNSPSATGFVIPSLQGQGRGGHRFQGHFIHWFGALSYEQQDLQPMCELKRDQGGCP